MTLNSASFVVGRATLFAGLVLLTLGAGVPAPRQRAASVMPVGVIGHWTAVPENGGSFTVADGERWNGVTDAGDLSRWSRELFGAASTPFVSHGLGEGAFPLAVAREIPSFGDGTLRVAFRLMGGASDQNAGIVFGLRLTGDYYFARYNTRDGDVAVWSYLNGQRAVLRHGEAHVQLPLGSWQELAVSIQGTEVRAWITGHDSVRVVHKLTSAPRGRVGLWTKRDAITAFRRFVAEPGTGG